MSNRFPNDPRVETGGVNNAERLLAALDAALDQPVELTLYGRASCHAPECLYIVISRKTIGLTGAQIAD